MAADQKYSDCNLNEGKGKNEYYCAADKNWGIGKNNELLVKYSGRYEDVPSGNNRKSMLLWEEKHWKAFQTEFLKNRTNIVFTHNQRLSGKRCGDRSQYRGN